MTKAEQPTITQSLKPCPFCGGEAVSVIGLRNHRGFGVRCGVAKCYASIGCYGETQAQATEKWNTRTTSLAAQEPAAMRYNFDGYGWKYIDSGSGSDWQTRHADAEPLYASLAAQDGLVDALEYARSQIIGLAVSGTDRIDELCRKLQKVDPRPIWPIPFPDPPERTWQPIVKRIDEALSAIKGDKS